MGGWASLGRLVSLRQVVDWTHRRHLPLLLAPQHAWLDVDWPWPLKLTFALGTTLAVCLASYRLLIRLTARRRDLG